jgi:modulator of FtsH protease HflC
MSAERLAEAALLRAVGESQSIKVRAEADRNYVKLVSTARRESEIIRGEGDAERNKVFAEAYSKDPEFFSFTAGIACLCRAESTKVLFQ